MSNIKLIKEPDQIKKKEVLGSGSYGKVYNVSIPNLNLPVALKRNFVDINTNHYGNIRELDLLIRLNDHPFIAKITHVVNTSNMGKILSPVNRKNIKDDDIHFMFDLAAYDGSKLLEFHKNKFDVMKLVMTQLLLGIEYMHSKNIIHRDLKLNNTLWYNIDGNYKIKITDLGLSKIQDQSSVSTPKTVTHWYRAPEIILNRNVYDEKIDIWSLACIFYELINGKALLEERGKEDNDKKNLELILKKIPCEPNPEFLKALEIFGIQREAHSPYSRYCENMWRKIIHLNENEISNFSRLAGPLIDFIDLLSHMFEFDPKKRYSATEALNHKFFHNKDDIIPNIIKTTRINNPPIKDSLPLIHIKSTNYRLIVSDLAFSIYNNHTLYSWYKHRMLFLTIDIMDRWIDHIKLDQDITFDKTEVELRFYIALFISIKYFTSMICPITLEKLLKPYLQTSYNLSTLKSLEYHMLNDVLKWQIYRPTVYEMINYISLGNELVISLRNNYDEHIYDLLEYYLLIEDFKGSPYKIFQCYLKTKEIIIPDCELTVETSIVPENWAKLEIANIKNTKHTIVDHTSITEFNPTTCVGNFCKTTNLNAMFWGN